jgi:hypothetical protein
MVVKKMMVQKENLYLKSKKRGADKLRDFARGLDPQ